MYPCRTYTLTCFVPKSSLKINFLPVDALTLEEYSALVEEGVIKGYSGKQHASAAERYADDYYARYDAKKGRVTWSKVKNKDTMILQHQVCVFVAMS